jgi:hypothetical protein
MTRKLKMGKRVFEDVDPKLARLELVDTHRFENGVMALTYGGAQ